MEYIIVWRNNHKEPFVDVDSRGFLETYSSYEDADENAKEIGKNENANEKSSWYFNYKIYKEVTS